MLKRRFPVALMKGALGLGLAFLLIAPAAVLWSQGQMPVSGKTRQPVERPVAGVHPSEVYPEWWAQQEVAWKEKSARPLYSRPADNWDRAVLGNPHLGHVPVAELKDDDTLILPMGKGSFHTRGAHPEIAAAVRKDVRGPARAGGEYVIAQLDPAAISGKDNAAIRKAIAGLGQVEILDYIPNNAYLLRVKGNGKQALLGSDLFQYVDAYHPAYKVAPDVGLKRLRSPERAASRDLDLKVRLHAGVRSAGVVAEIEKLGGTVKHVAKVFDHEVLAVSFDRNKLHHLANIDDVYGIAEKSDLMDMTLATSITVEMGRFIDPRQTNGFLRPFDDAGIDGGGTYVDDPNDIPGCLPFSAASGSVDPNCYLVQPQFIGLVDNGLTLDSRAFAHSNSSACDAAAPSCGSLASGLGVGVTHRKVELYRRAADLNANGPDGGDDATAEGDFLTCDSMTSGGDTHGTAVGGTMAGNPSGGQFGLGQTYEDVDNSNQFFSYFSDSWEEGLRMDGQAKGARVLFIDASDTPSVSPPPCATHNLSDVEHGVSIVNDLEALVYRPDLGGSGGLHARGAKVVVLPYGAPVDFDNNLVNGHGTYASPASDAEDIDRFLWNNRGVAVVVPVGNDGATPAGSDLDPIATGQPPPTFGPEDIQVQDMATGKNIVSVGANIVDNWERGFAPVDGSEFIANSTSKGPATFDSRRIAPLVVAPGFEPAFGAGGREGNYADYTMLSHAVITSFDNEQDNSEGVEDVRLQQKRGTSMASGKVGGAIAQIFDYFAKGYYPAGVAGGTARRDVSGMLAKAVLVASTDFAQQGPLIANCTAKFCIEQGYGKVELANALPLDTYPATRRPADASNIPPIPTTPNAMFVVDELWAGGVASDSTSSVVGSQFGVIELGGTRAYQFDVMHGGSQLRAALAWYDAPGDLLVNDLNLEVQDGDFDRSGNNLGRGTCGKSGISWRTGVPPNATISCGGCVATDQAYFDPNDRGDNYRRFLGNNFRDTQQFSHHAQCVAGTDTLDLADPDSIADDDNPTESVVLHHTNNTDVLGPTFIGATQGTGSEGFYKAVVRWPDSMTGRERAAPNTPCVVDGAGDGIDGSVASGDAAVRTTRDGLAYIPSGVDDPNTAGVDEARCDSTAAGDDIQVCPAGARCTPFSLVVAGAIATSHRPHIELNKVAYDCSDTSLRVTVTGDESSTAGITTKVSADTKIDVIDPNGVVVDTEKGVNFAAIVAPSVFRIWRAMTNVSTDWRVQYIGNTGRAAISNNGLIEVEDGCTIRATYDQNSDLDPNTFPEDTGDVDVTTEAPVRCTPLVSKAFALIFLENANQRFVGGGCDFGRFIGSRGDMMLDAGERVLYQVFFANHTETQVENLTATLTCQNPAGTSMNPCQYVSILDPVQHVGRLPFTREGAGAWNLDIDEGVRTLPTSERHVEFKVTFSATNSDYGGQLATQSFLFHEALEADNERLFWSTDAPRGGTLARDFNLDGQIQIAELGNGGRREERELRTYQDWTGGPNARYLTGGANACAGNTDCVPFSFDVNDGGLTSRLSADSKPGPGCPNNGWFWGTGGGCGWQSRIAGVGAAKGVWHAGQGPIPVVPSFACGTYCIPSDPATAPLIEFTTYHLTSQTFFKTNTGTDARGFPFELKMEALSWNENQEIADSRVTMRIEIDTNLDDDGPVNLDDTYTYRAAFNLGATLLNAAQGARRFGPGHDPGLSLNSGVETGEEVGISRPLAAYDANNIFTQTQLLPLMPFPARDADTSDTDFDSDTRISNGSNCPPVQVGRPCRPSGFTTSAGPVRNRDLDTGSSFEDFNGASGTRFAFQYNWIVREGGTGATGWTLDDILFEWSEQHPADPVTFVGGDCSLRDPAYGGTCVPDPNTAGAGTCSGGPRNGLFCATSFGNEDCDDIAVEGTCVSGRCTTGRVGLSCLDRNDCDLGRCKAGNLALGCAVDADCNLSTNSCEAIPFRISPTTAVGASAVARQCALISFERLFNYDCTSSMETTVQDETPNLCGPSTPVSMGGPCNDPNTQPRQVVVNARTGPEPLGEWFRLTETSSGSGVFVGDVKFSAINDQRGFVFVDSDPGERVNIVVSYNDDTCDQDNDGFIGETDFADIDGDGVLNFGVDGVSRDQDPVKRTAGGFPTTDDDNCFNPAGPFDVFNPVGVAQLDTPPFDGVINSLDCNVDPNNNETGQCDFDEDGFGDICDNCPYVVNEDQLDTDADGIGNVCEVNDIDGDGFINVSDNCPTVYNPSQDQASGGGKGGSRFNKGVLCDDSPPSNADYDLDGIPNTQDNCPQEGLIESDGDPNTTGFFPGPCPGGATFCTYNPDQRDTDADGIGDLCESEDFDGDGVINTLDNCETVYNPADPSFGFQVDSDGDGRGDDRAGTDQVGSCVGGPTPGRLCIGINTGSTCGPGGFCVQSGDAYCDFDSQDDNNSGIPDDLISFTTEIDCNYAPNGIGFTAAEVAAVALGGAVVTDDGTADFVCVNPGADPDPNHVGLDDCPNTNASHRAASVNTTTGPADSSCDTSMGAGDGNCEPVPDGIVDPGEIASAILTLANGTADVTGAPRAISNTTVGIRALRPSVGCVLRGQVFMGQFGGGGVLVTPTEPSPIDPNRQEGVLKFILSPVTGQSTPQKFIEAEFLVTIQGDGIEANTPEQSFKLTGDIDQTLFPTVPNACNGGALSGFHSDPNNTGAVCEDFDTERNGVSGHQFSRLYAAVHPNGDPLRGLEDPNDDVIGHTVDGGPLPFGIEGNICSSDFPFAAARATCWVVPTENDFHEHTGTEGCDDTYEPSSTFDAHCDGGLPRAHSGTRSMHMGRHLNATSTLGDTYRFRQTSAFIMDPMNIGTSSLMEFWHIMQVVDWKVVGIGRPNTNAGSQVQLAIMDNATGFFEPWQRLTPTQNPYNALDQEAFTICEFDPGDDQFPGTNEPMCGGQPQWSDVGDFYGSNLSCFPDSDGNDPVDGDCGQTTNRTVVGGCSWISDPTCGSFLENGTTGPGVWARSQFDLSAFGGRTARLRWVFEGGGGWSFAESRSFLEPEPGGLPSQIYDGDEGWFIDDIRVTDIRSGNSVINPDTDDGLASCPSQGDTNNCGQVTLNITGAVDDDDTAGDTILHAQSSNLGTLVRLDAQSSGADLTPSDPNYLAPPQGGCRSGILEYQWVQLDDHLGNVVSVLSPFSPKGAVNVTTLADATYRVDARCSSDPTCVGSKEVNVLVYTGDGSDLNSEVHNHSPIGLLDGIYIDHDPSTNQATLSWRARPQPPGVSGFDVFRHTVTDIAVPAEDPFDTDQFQGSCFQNAVANGLPGSRVTLSGISSMPAVSDAHLYMIGHSSQNTQAIAPLGRRPSVSTRAGTLVSASVTCP